WDEWTERRKPEVYNGRNMDYLRGLLPDQTPVCPHLKNWNDSPQTAVPINVAAHSPASSSGAAPAGGQKYTFKQLWTRAEVAKKAGNVEESIQCYDAALGQAEEQGEITEDLLFSLMNVGREFQGLGNHAQAIKFLRKCVVLSEQHHSNPDFTADLFNDIAYSQRTTRDFDGAVSSLDESLRRKRANSNTPPLSLARTLIDLGTLHDFCMRREAAAPLLTEARAIYAAHLPDNDPQHLYLKNVYACLLTHIGKYDDAEKLYDHVIKERVKLLGENSSDVAFTYNDLGFHHKSTGNFEASEKAFRKCIEIRQKVLGSEDLEVAAAHDDLSWMFREKGDFAQAKRELEKALAIRKRLLVPGDSQVSMTYLALADVCNELGDKQGAAQARKNAERK
ncbi:MAG TPA: tetratricopeptide repeat protein, partial [Drouetiella sp.]